MRIAYVIPDGYLCGGNRIVAEHCKGLAGLGHEMVIALVNPYKNNYDWLKKLVGEKVSFMPLYDLANSEKKPDFSVKQRAH